MSDEFFKTRMGRKFYEADVPRIATALESIASELDRLNTDRELSSDIGEKLVVEQVCLVQSPDTEITVYASARAAREALRDTWQGQDLPMATHWLKLLDEWDGQSDATIAGYHLKVATVNL